VDDLHLQLPLTWWFGEDDVRGDRAVAFVVSAGPSGTQLVAFEAWSGRRF
jgi:hypothetical protein